MQFLVVPFVDADESVGERPAGSLGRSARQPAFASERADRAYRNGTGNRLPGAVQQAGPVLRCPRGHRGLDRMDL